MIGTLSRRATIIGLATMSAARARADDAVQIYAAMTFRAGLEAVLAAFRAGGGQASAVYAPTPALVRQLAGGAPADILLTADAGWMDDAASRGLIRPDTRAVLMSNDLVLAGPAGAAPAAITRDFDLLGLLAGGRLAMCDPDRDPAGRFARQSLEALGFWPALAGRIAIAESSPAAVTMLDRGEVPAATCFATDLHGDTGAAAIGRFPADSHSPIVYPVALTTQAAAGAAPVLAFLRSASASAIFANYGYRAPG